MSIQFIELAEFERDKKHLRKFRHIEEDLLTFKQALTTGPTNVPGVEEVSEKNRQFCGNIYKATKFRSRDIPNKGAHSGFRVIFHYDPLKEIITFIQIYNHNQGVDDYDRERLEKNFPK